MRIDRLHSFGCVCCRKLGTKNTQVDIHHIVRGNRRLGDEYTLPLCAYHHRGILPATLEIPCRPEDLFGPSRHLHGRRAFERQWGTEMELLEYVNSNI